MTSARAVAVLGAGIMGASTALHLARRGTRVTVFDPEDAPFCGASRWNEGKIHLGFLYANDPTLNTARAVIPGGLDFKDQVEELTGASLESATTPADDVYLVHRDSVTPAEIVQERFAAVANLVCEHPDAHRYLADASSARVETLKPSAIDSMADPSIVVAGFRVPERSVDTNVVADAFVAALDDATAVELALRHPVTHVAPAAGDSARWYVHAADQRHGPFTAVVNALWEGRPRLDRAVGHQPDVSPHHRFRVSLFVRTSRDVTAPSAVLAVGPFGDVKSYTPRAFYLSWYPAGLLTSSDSVDAPARPTLDDDGRQRIVSRVFTELGAILPWVVEIERAATAIRVEGGWVYSQGRGALDDPSAGVHRRDRLGITTLGSYYSVDTGKYSVAPTLAGQVAAMIAAL